jgi:hypothetical protein
LTTPVEITYKPKSIQITLHRGDLMYHRFL